MFIFSVGQKDNKALINTIKDFLDSIAIEQSYVIADKSRVNIYPAKPNTRRVMFLNLTVKDLNYIESVIIPLLDRLT